MPPKAAKGKEAKKEPPKLAMGPPPKPKKIPPPPACFSPEDLARFKEVFKAHDEDNIDKVKLPEIPIMLRKLGFNPKGSEIKLLYEKFLEDEFVDTVEYFEWLFMIEAKINMGDDFELAVTKAMATLGHDDEETGITDLELLKEELMSWGEPLLEIEFVDFIKVATKNKTFTPLDGKFNYVKFIELMNNSDQKFFKEPINFFKLDQKTLAAMAMKKAQEEKEEEERKEAERLAKEEAKRQKLIQQGLILPD
ncbi:calmodulin-2 isoform X1 [Papilio machaon]|uniref:calmodulin-2 isoform X1 n=1 Tax=Papilio machaon TaxID=76193 RepID=UPI001E664F03|nr:calmodulin-2 isoform X1 [Papilio machaon]XP_045536264.1 calmodulin-2 isoform X1 [Papilio machaon]